MLNSRQVEQRLGMASFVAWHSGCSLPTSTLVEELLPAIQLEQCWFAFDSRMNPVALWTWARLSERGAARLASDPRCKPRPWEWDEGGALWLIHVMHCGYRLRDVVLYVRTHLAAPGEPIYRQKPRATASPHVAMVGLPKAAYDRRTSTSYTQTLPRSHFGSARPEDG